jgi:putative transposase
MYYSSTRVREKLMRRFKSARHLHRFVSVHDQVVNLFTHCRYTPTQSKSGRHARRP